VGVPHSQDRPPIDPGTRLILEELRDLRLEMRADRLRAAAERRRADERFEQLLRGFQRDSGRRQAATQKAFAATQQAFRDIRTVGLSIVKTLSRHTQILERIDRKLGARGNGRPGHDGRGG
jgi:hypothetical protein